MKSSQDIDALILSKGGAVSFAKLASETVNAPPLLGLPFAHLADSASMFSTRLPNLLTKQAGNLATKAHQRSQSGGPRGLVHSKSRPAACITELEAGKRSKDRRRRPTTSVDVIHASAFNSKDGEVPSPPQKRRQAVAVLSLSQAAFSAESVGFLERQRTWHRADFVFEDELSKGPDVQWFRAIADKSGLQDTSTSGQAADVAEEKVHRLKRGQQKKSEQQHKRAERQVQIAERLETLRKKPGVLQQLASGAFAGVVSRTFVAPLDLIKTHLVTGHGSHGAPKSATLVAARIYQEGGWKAFFRGNGINCLRVAPCKAIELCVFENLRRRLSKDEGSPLSYVAAPVAGGAAGMMSTIATYPLELMRTRMMVQPQIYTSIGSTFNKIVAQEGVGALYNGLQTSVLGVFPYAATNYGVYAGLRSAYKKVTKKDYVPTVPTLLFGAAAASASSALTFPLEVARRQMQLGTVGGQAVYKNAFDVVQTIYAEEGFLALYRGLGTTCVKLIPAAAVSCMCYEAARLALRVDDASIKKRENEKDALREEKEGLALQTEGD